MNHHLVCRLLHFPNLHRALGGYPLVPSIGLSGFGQNPADYVEGSGRRLAPARPWAQRVATPKDSPSSTTESTLPSSASTFVRVSSLSSQAGGTASLEYIAAPDFPWVGGFLCAVRAIITFQGKLGGGEAQMLGHWLHPANQGPQAGDCSVRTPGERAAPSFPLPIKA